MLIRLMGAAALATALSATAAGQSQARIDQTRYVAGAPLLMLQVCGAFHSGRPMTPVLQDLEAWPAHEPLRKRLLGDREGRVFLTRQFGYGLYAIMFDATGQCGVEVFAVPTGLAREKFAEIHRASALAAVSSPMLFREAAEPQSIPLTRAADGAGLDFRLLLTEDDAGQGSASFVLVRKPAPGPRPI